METVICIVETPRDFRSPGDPPVHLGFVPGTSANGREAVGALVLNDAALPPGAEVQAVALGVLRTGDDLARLICGEPGSELTDEMRSRIARLHPSAEWLPAEAAAGLLAESRMRFRAATIGPAE